MQQPKCLMTLMSVLFMQSMFDLHLAQLHNQQVLGASRRAEVLNALLCLAASETSMKKNPEMFNKKSRRIWGGGGIEKKDEKG